MLPDAELAGRAIVITGAGRGLGREYALAVAAAGAQVVVNDLEADLARAVASEIDPQLVRAVPSAHDVTDPAEAAALIDVCASRFGRIDGLVNNAGLFESGAAWTTTPERMRDVVDVNVLGSLQCGVAAMRAMLRARSGVIVNVTSGAHLGMAGMATYAATKGAVASLTYAWAADLEPHGIRVCALSPVAQTRMSDLAEWSAALPDPALIAPAVVYLLSERARGLNGEVVRFDGRSVSVLRQPEFIAAHPPQDGWTLEQIADAADAALSARASSTARRALQREMGPAVDDDRGSVDVRRGGREQEAHDLGNLLGSPGSL